MESVSIEEFDAVSPDWIRVRKTYEEAFIYIYTVIFIRIFIL